MNHQKYDPATLLSESGYSKPDGDGLDWTGGFQLTEEEADAFENASYVYDGMVIRSHVVALIAAANGGKTTVCFNEIAVAMLNKGYRVVYVNVDVSQADVKSMVKHAKKHGIALLLPDIKGRSAQEVLDNLKQMADEERDCSDLVLFIDTVKKFTSMTNKEGLKIFLGLMRRLSAQTGMTIILLGHANKYPDADGMPVYEGTADLRSDVDELIYLIPTKEPDGSLTVSTIADKVRGRIEPMSFGIDASLKVKRLDDYVDVLTAEKQQQQYEADRDLLNAIVELVGNGSKNQSEIIAAMKGKASRKTVRRILIAYSKQDAYKRFFSATKDKANHNQFIYAIRPGSLKTTRWKWHRQGEVAGFQIHESAHNDMLLVQQELEKLHGGIVKAYQL